MIRAGHRTPARRAPQATGRLGGGWVAPFGQMLVVGLAVTALALPGVTLPAAMAAGVRNLDRHLTHRPDSLVSLVVDAARAARTGWWVGLVWAAVVGALVVNVRLVLVAPVPMGEAVAVLSGLSAVAVTVVVLRAAALWRPGSGWRALILQAAQDCVSRWGPTCTVVAGIGAAAVLVWMLPPLVVLTPGMVALALVATAREAPEGR